MQHHVDNQGSDTRRGAGLVLINLIGQCGPILGTRVYPASEGPRFVKGMSICAAFMLFTAVMALMLRTLLILENTKLEKERNGMPATKEAKDDGAAVAVENYGPNFRYVL